MADVVVIGGGISGLSAAWLLHKAKLKVLVLEARDRVGGRTYTKQSDTYGTCDLGGAYVGPTQNKILRLCKELDLKLHPVFYEGNSVLSFRNSNRIKFTKLQSPTSNPLLLCDILHLQRTIDRLAREVPVDEPWRAPQAREWDRLSCREFRDKQCWFQLTRDLFDSLLGALLCCGPHEASLLAFLWYIHSAQLLQRAISVKHGAQEMKVIGGSQQVCQRLAAHLGNRVRFSCPVVSLTQSESGVVVLTAEGEKLHAKHAIVAMSPTMMHRIHFHPPLSPGKAQSFQRMPMGSIIKTVTYYPRPVWREQGYNGSIVCLNKDPVVFSLDDTKPDNRHPALMGFVLAEHSRQMQHLSKRERQQRIAEQYANYFGCEELKTPSGYEEYNWSADPWSGGCYVGLMSPGFITQYLPFLRLPEGRVYFAGTECATRWSGYMDGAVEAGERAARQILASRGLLPEHEIDPEEPESEEYPSQPFPPAVPPAPSVGTLLLVAGAVIAVGVAAALTRFL